jgi:ATPase subunit of ABC transporter with duplicated ATPase domains
MLGQLSLDGIRPSSRKYPHVVFNPEKLHGKAVVRLDGVSKSIAGERLFADVSLTITRGERVVIVSKNSLESSALLEVIAGAQEPDSGTVEWAGSVVRSFVPKDNAALFDVDLDLINWLRQYSDDKDENFVRSFLGRMLFTGEESKKKASVLSGGEKVRCMIARLMLDEPQCMVLDGPTNHLDLESITSLNNALIKFSGTLIFSSHDVEFIQSLADRVIEITPDGVIDHQFDYEEFLRRRTDEPRLVASK